LTSILALAQLFSKALSHIIASLLAALVVQLFLPSARDWRVYLGTSIAAILVGILAYMAGVDFGMTDFLSHFLASMGGAFIYGVMAQFVSINQSIASSKDITNLVVTKIKEKLK